MSTTNTVICTHIATMVFTIMAIYIN